MSNTRLVDIGERHLVSDYLAPRYGGGSKWRFGDDCAVILDTRESPAEDCLILATTDPGPRPVAWDLGFKDYYYWGWLTATLNWSDIAAVGASPLGLLTSLTLSNEMLLDDFLRLLDGIDECSEFIGSEVHGGNLKEGDSIRCEATAFGIVRDGMPMSRSGARAGQLVCAIGRTGLFWAGLLATKARLTLDSQDAGLVRETLLQPVPLVQVGEQLRHSRLVSSCTDSSDGLYGAFVALSQFNDIGIELDADGIEYCDTVLHISRLLNVDPLRLALGFGDLQLVCTAAEDNVAELQSICRALSVEFTLLGHVYDGEGVLLTREGRTGRLTNLDNERFTKRSQFTGGLDAFQANLLKSPLWVTTS
jgi:thiamine-monophosphate kinase